MIQSIKHAILCLEFEVTTLLKMLKDAIDLVIYAIIWNYDIGLFLSSNLVARISLFKLNK
jgi:hypothetical protein